MTLSTVNLIFFFFNDTATTEIYTLSLHDALPISFGAVQQINVVPLPVAVETCGAVPAHRGGVLEVALEARRSRSQIDQRSEEHTSELQSQSNLVCRLLLEKKKINIPLALSSHSST